MSQLTELSPGLRKIAVEELNAVEARTSEDLAALRDWLTTQPHLKTRTDDRFLLAFLRGAKFSLEKAKSKIDWYYTIQAMLPEIFYNNEIDERIQTLIRFGTYARLPQTVGADGPRIHFSIMKNMDFKHFQLEDFVRYVRLVTQSQFFNDENCIVSGYIHIYDVEDVSLRFFKHFDFMLWKKMSIFAQKAMPARSKSVHLVNFPKEYYSFLELCKSLISEKLKKRLYLHKNIDELCEVIPRKYLPKEYGGENGSITDINAEAERIIKSYDFKQDEQYTVDEKLRPMGLKKANAVFGIEGSFRKLDID